METEQFHLDAARQARKALASATGKKQREALQAQLKFHTREALALRAKNTPKTIGQAVDQGVRDGSLSERIKTRTQKIDETSGF